MDAVSGWPGRGHRQAASDLRFIQRAVSSHALLAEVSASSRAISNDNCGGKCIKGSFTEEPKDTVAARTAGEEAPSSRGTGKERTLAPRGMSPDRRVFTLMQIVGGANALEESVRALITLVLATIAKASADGGAGTEAFMINGLLFSETCAHRQNVLWKIKKTTSVPGEKP